MRIRKTQWAVWNKNLQRFHKQNGVMIWPDRERAWLIAGKERKDSPYKVVMVNVSICKK